MSLAAIDWHPKRQGMLAVSPVRNLTFDERTNLSGRPFTSYILLWYFVDLIHPQLMLESPHEMLCFRFNRCPGQHGLVAAGCVNGQVLLFDTAEAMVRLSEKNGKRGGASRVRRVDGRTKEQGR